MTWLFTCQFRQYVRDIIRGFRLCKPGRGL